MKFFLFFIFQMVALTSLASKWIDISLLQLQFRYEDTSMQSKETATYQSFGAAYQQDIYRLGFGYSRHQDQSGNASLSIENEKKEYLFDFGYQVFKFENDSKKISLDLFVDAIAGWTQSRVDTKLFSTSSSSNSSNSAVFGVGSSAVGRISYLLLETDLAILTADSFTPQYVPVLIFKAGLSFPLP